MASSYHYALFAFFLFAGHLCDASNYNILDFEIARKHELWMINYGRVYKDEAEKARRLEIYKENIKYIEDFNSVGDHKYTLGEGPFTDLTTEEFLATYVGGLKVPKTDVDESIKSFEYERMESILNYTSLPSKVDWKAKGAVSSVKNQGSVCSSCWAFVSAAAVEGITKIKKGVLYDLSPQQLIDCDTRNNGCQPGYMHKAFEYIQRNGGITTWANYPYTAINGTCDAFKASQTVTTISGYGRVISNNEWALMVAVSRQPIGVGVEVSDDFQHYTGGVFHGSCGTATNHAVLVIGYDDTDTSDKYWIVKNSWGTGWGEAGYIRMEKDVAAREGLCGIAMWPYYPKM